jgi:hypothetical protein
MDVSGYVVAGLFCTGGLYTGGGGGGTDVLTAASLPDDFGWFFA